MGENRDTDKNGRSNEEGNNDEFKEIFHMSNLPQISFRSTTFMLFRMARLRIA